MKVEQHLCWVKREALEFMVHPQLPSFCGVAACAGVLGATLRRGQHRCNPRSPIRAYALPRLAELARADQRYGFVLLSERPLPPDLFDRWTEAMLPDEARLRQRFARRDGIA